MSTITITNNFNAPIGQHIDHVDRIEAHFDKDMGMQISLCDTPPTSSPSPSGPLASSSSPSSSEPYLAQDALFKYIHPSISTDADKSQITREIQNLVASFPLPEICRYLMDMKKANRIYLNVKPEMAFAELHRMGMPNEQTEGFSYKTFTKYYNTN